MKQGRAVQRIVRRHPRIADAAAAAVLAAVNTDGLIGTDAGVLAWTWFFMAHLPLIWRRAAPVPVFWLAYGMATVHIVAMPMDLESVYPETLVLLALYSLARHGPRAWLWPAAASLAVPMIIGLIVNGHPSIVIAFAVTAEAAVVLFGVTRRTKQAYLDELEERARLLELDRDRQAELATAAERARITGEMHDIVAHNLSVMIALADGAALTAAASPQRATEAMRQVSQSGRQALGEVRRLLGLARNGVPVRAADRLPQPGVDDVDALVDEVRAAGVRVTLMREGEPGPWSPGAQLTVYRIAQEALTNVLKHAGVQARARVRLTCTSTGARLEVVDDGGDRPAADGVGDGTGHGLVGMRERAAPYDGEVVAGPMPGGGWRVLATLRLADKEAA